MSSCVGFNLLHCNSNQPAVLPPVSSVSPYSFLAWLHRLKNCPSENKNWFLQGLFTGFSLGCSPKTLISAYRNTLSAYQHPEVTSDYLKSEVEFNGIAGPFKQPPLPNLHINRFGVIPKSTPGKWRLITDLSCPSGASVNDGIPKEICHFTCPGIQEAIGKIMRYGRGSLLAEFDLNRAYRCLPVCEEEKRFLGMFWQGNYYVGLALPFGVSRAPNIFNRAADLLQWILGEDESVREDDIQHYYDDFLVVGPPNSNSCDLSLDTCLYICDDLGVPVEPLKDIPSNHMFTVFRFPI